MYRKTVESGQLEILMFAALGLLCWVACILLQSGPALHLSRVLSDAILGGLSRF